MFAVWERFLKNTAAVREAVAVGRFDQSLCFLYPLLACSNSKPAVRWLR